jgi:DNA-binding SARP family transcriptional activator
LALRDDPEGGRWLSKAAQAASELGADVLRAWAEMLFAHTAARHAAPEASELMAGARARARACGLHHAEELVAHAFLRAAALPLASGTVVDRSAVMVRCFGGFAIEVGGRPASLPELRPLPRALLQLLALHLGQDLHREVIITSLWRDVPVDAAAHRLHAAASTVRRALTDSGVPGAELQRRGSGYRLVLGDAKSDVGELERALREAARSEAAGDLAAALRWSRRAMELYAGDLLPEAGPDEWVVAERDRLKVGAATAAYAVSSLGLRLGAPQEALQAAHRAIELDPLRDSAWALLAEVQTRMGDVSAAAATRRAHAALTEELVTPPPAPRGARRAPV